VKDMLLLAVLGFAVFLLPWLSQSSRIQRR
jgi:hypothetical protein